MNFTRRTFLKSSAGVAALCVLESGCSPASLIGTLQLVVTAAETAIAALSSTIGIPPALVPVIIGYLDAVNSAASKAATILADATTTAAEKAALIAAAFASVLAAKLPAGLPSQIASLLSDVATAVLNFLGAIPKNLKGVSSQRFALSANDLRALDKIRAGTQSNSTALARVKR